MKLSRHNTSYGRRRGFIALMSVIIAGAVALAIGIGISLRSIDQENMSINQQESQRAQALTDFCAETALMKIESVLDYSGEIISLNAEEMCEIISIEGVGNSNRTIKILATAGDYTKKIRIVISQISPKIIISSWEEVADF